jgi:hypothetical protein
MSFRRSLSRAGVPDLFRLGRIADERGVAGRAQLVTRVRERHMDLRFVDVMGREYYLPTPQQRMRPDALVVVIPQRSAALRTIGGRMPTPSTRIRGEMVRRTEGLAPVPVTRTEFEENPLIAELEAQEDVLDFAETREPVLREKRRSTRLAHIASKTNTTDRTALAIASIARREAVRAAHAFAAEAFDRALRLLWKMVGSGARRLVRSQMNAAARDWWDSRVPVPRTQRVPATLVVRTVVPHEATARVAYIHGTIVPSERAQSYELTPE